MNKSTITRIEKYSDYKVYTNNINISNYLVRTSDGIELGLVESIIVDIDTNKILYLEINTNQHVDNPDKIDKSLKGKLDKNIRYEEDGDHYMLIPIGVSKLKKDEQEIVVSGFSSSNIYMVPRHKKSDDISSENNLENLKSYTEKMDSYFSSVGDQWRRNYKSNSFRNSPLFVNW